MTQEKLKHKNIEIKTEGLETNLQLYCNKIQIEQVLMNLISNSIDAIESLPEKWIKVRITHIENFYLLRVIDSGKGINPETVEKMMNPFYTTKPIGQGTGLGLSISKGIIEKHHGTFEYQLFDGHTSFVITLPKAANHMSATKKAA